MNPAVYAGAVKAKIDELHGTQCAVGAQEVEFREETYRQKLAKMSQDEWKKYLKKNAIPVIETEDGYYILDSHHMVKALQNIGKNKVYVEVVAKLSREDVTAFWKKMIDNHWAYNFDQNGKGPYTPAQMEALIPKWIEDMLNDPYRGLAGRVRDRGGYKKVRGQFFTEFDWADFFRSRIKLGIGGRYDEKIILEAIELAHSDEARDLPGYFESPCHKAIEN
jgi:hypothetical protein